MYLCILNTYLVMIFSALWSHFLFMFRVVHVLQMLLLVFVSVTVVLCCRTCYVCVYVDRVKFVGHTETKHSSHRNVS